MERGGTEENAKYKTKIIFNSSKLICKNYHWCMNFLLQFASLPFANN